MAETPSGLDRADGVDTRPGTVTPDGAVKVSSANNSTTIQFEELPNSPVFERGEQATIRHTYRTSYTDAMTRINTLYRGIIRQDTYGNFTKIVSATVEHEQGDSSLLTVVEEGLSFDSPPDSFRLTPVELGIDITKHPRYFYAFLGDGYGSNTERLNQAVIRILQDYIANPSAQYRDALIDLLWRSTGTPGTVGAAIKPLYPNGLDSPASTVSTIPGTAMAKRAAIEIIMKHWRGEEQPYIVGWILEWKRYYFRPPYLNPGGYVEDPIYDANPQFPVYFYSPTWPPSESFTVFDYMAAYNPQCYSTTGTAAGSVNISWLRKADHHDFQRTFTEVTRTWMGSPIGYWDTQLYSSSARPKVPGDYLKPNKT